MSRMALMSRVALMSSLLAGGIALAVTMTPSEPPPAEEQQDPPPAENKADRAKDRQESVDHVKTIMLGVGNYRLANNDHFPPPAIFGPDGQPKLSWRVALLPYLDEKKLYDEFRQDEPWDSPHNKSLIARMPDVYRTPHSPAPDGQSRFRGITGKGTIFEGTEGIKLTAITDGDSNTAVIAMALEPIPWTKPDELTIDEGKMPRLDNVDPGWGLVGMADGASLFVAVRDAVMLRAMSTRNGGEVITWPPQPFRRAAAQPAQEGLPTPPPEAPKRPPVSLEQRLESVEKKLDLLMEKVDSLAGKKP